MTLLPARIGFSSSRLRALTHRSFSPTDNERLEFLGDAVLNLAVSRPAVRPLRRLRKRRRSRRACAPILVGGHLHQLALRNSACRGAALSWRARRESGRRAASVHPGRRWRRLIGAVYLDAGFAAAKALVHRLFGRVVEINPQMQAGPRTPRPNLQEWLQARAKCPCPPTASWCAARAHAQTFEVECAVAGAGPDAEAWRGPPRRQAEQEAARHMLDVLKASDRPTGPLRS